MLVSADTQRPANHAPASHATAVASVQRRALGGGYAAQAAQLAPTGEGGTGQRGGARGRGPDAGVLTRVQAAFSGGEGQRAHGGGGAHPPGGAPGTQVTPPGGAPVTPPGGTPVTPPNAAQGPQTVAPAAAPGPPALTSHTEKAARIGGTRRTTVGVGEVVHFQSSVAGQWRAGGVDGPSATEFSWTAPGAAASVDITCTVGQHTSTIQIRVIEPERANVIGAGSLDMSSRPHSRAGIKGRYEYFPVHVSFANIETREASGGSSGNYGCFANPGSFPDGLYHWSGGRNQEADFTADMADDNKDRGWDEISQFGRHGPGPGGFDWVIPIWWRLNGSAHQMGTVTQYTRMDPNGSLRLRKGEAFIQGDVPP